MLILETPFWVAGAAESMKMSIIVIGASNKSGRRCKPSDEMNLIYLMYLHLSGTKRCSFWRQLEVSFSGRLEVSLWARAKGGRRSVLPSRSAIAFIAFVVSARHHTQANNKTKPQFNHCRKTPPPTSLSSFSLVL